VIVAGFGFRHAATARSLADALARAMGDAVPSHCATAENKHTHAAFRTFAEEAGLTILSVSAAELAAQDTRTQSQASRAAHGTGSVAEAAALAAAGPGARLLASRMISGDRLATCAIATGEAS